MATFYTTGKNCAGNKHQQRKLKMVSNFIKTNNENMFSLQWVYVKRLLLLGYDEAVCFFSQKNAQIIFNNACIATFYFISIDLYTSTRKYRTAFARGNSWPTGINCRSTSLLIKCCSVTNPIF